MAAARRRLIFLDDLIASIAKMILASSSSADIVNCKSNLWSKVRMVMPRKSARLGGVPR